MPEPKLPEEFDYFSPPVNESLTPASTAPTLAGGRAQAGRTRRLFFPDINFPLTTMRTAAKTRASSLSGKLQTVRL
ncbi:MAG: hypothetical protein WKF84_07335 [Pyrinomonadaceae bacterium]